MPAINLLKLDKQLNDLLWSFTDPPEFIIKLENLLDQYSNTTYQPGADILKSVEKPEINVPLLVLNRMDLALSQAVSEHPDSALDLCIIIWQSPNLELHTAAARILGQVPMSHSDMVLMMLEKQASKTSSQTSLNDLVTNATVTIRSSDPEILVEKSRKWCQSSENPIKMLGLNMLSVLISDISFENIPAVYSILEKMLNDELPIIYQDPFYQILEKLLKRSPIETSFFIRECYEKKPSSKMISRLARKCLPDMQEPSKSILTEDLRKNQFGKKP